MRDGEAGEGESGDGESGEGESGDGESGEGESGDGESGEGESGDAGGLGVKLGLEGLVRTGFGGKPAITRFDEFATRL